MQVRKHEGFQVAVCSTAKRGVQDFIYFCSGHRCGHRVGIVRALSGHRVGAVQVSLLRPSVCRASRGSFRDLFIWLLFDFLLLALGHSWRGDAKGKNDGEGSGQISLCQR